MSGEILEMNQLIINFSADRGQRVTFFPLKRGNYTVKALKKDFKWSFPILSPVIGFLVPSDVSIVPRKCVMLRVFFTLDVPFCEAIK